MDDNEQILKELEELRTMMNNQADAIDSLQGTIDTLESSIESLENDLVKDQFYVNKKI